MFYLGKHMPDVEVVQYLPERFAIAHARNLGVELAIQAKCDYFFWLDDDTVLLNEQTIHRLLEVIIRKPKISMISPAYYIRSYPFRCMGFRPTGPHSFKLLEPNDEFEMADQEGIVMGLRAIGNGCTMFNMDIFTKMENACTNREWYKTNRPHTEDVFFCVKAASVDPLFQCAIDTTITAAHMKGMDWIHMDNIRYQRLKFKVACALSQDPSRYEALEKLVKEWDPKLEDVDTPLHLDNSLGRC